MDELKELFRINMTSNCMLTELYCQHTETVDVKIKIDSILDFFTLI